MAGAVCEEGAGSWRGRDVRGNLHPPQSSHFQVVWELRRLLALWVDF